QLVVTVHGYVEIVAVRIDRAVLGVETVARALEGRPVALLVEFFGDRLVVLHLEAEMVEAGRLAVVLVGVDREVDVAVGERDAAARVIALSMLAVARQAPAQLADVYEGKQIRWVVGTAAGQDYDAWSRLIARHIVRYIPGNPGIVVENMPGAGHILATNYLFNV